MHQPPTQPLVDPYRRGALDCFQHSEAVGGFGFGAHRGQHYVSRYTESVFPPVSWTEPAETHIARHQVAPHEVEEILYGRPRYIAAGRAGTRLVFGATAAGRLLLVVVAGAPDGGVAIVTARSMTDTESRTFRRKGS